MPPDVNGQRERSKRKWWITGGLAIASALVGGVLAGVTDIGALPVNALKVPEQAGPKIEEAIGPAAIHVIDVHRLPGSTGDVLLPANPAQREAALNDLLRPSAEWKDRYDVISVGNASWEITLETFRDERVEITNMTPVFDGGGCDKPLGGALLQNGSSGALDKILLDIEIDSPRPVFMTQLSRNDPFVPYFSHRAIGLEKGKKDSIIVTARATTGYCKWRIKAEYYAAGAKREILLSRPDGKPFELTASLNQIELYETVVPDPLICRDKTPQPVSGKDYAALLRVTDPSGVPPTACR